MNLLKRIGTKCVAAGCLLTVAPIIVLGGVMAICCYTSNMKVTIYGRE